MHRSIHLAQALLEQKQRAINCLRHIDRRRHCGRLAGKGFERGNDAAHLFRQLADDSEIFLGRGEITAIHELNRICRKGTNRAERLTQLMGNPGRHLAQHGELGGLHQLILRRA